jgi:hypothetical protein
VSLSLTAPSGIPGNLPVVIIALPSMGTLLGGPYNSPDLVGPRLVFRAYLATSYVPPIWQQVKVAFMPKPGRNSYSGPGDYRPINLTSFLLKTLEKLVDR